MPWWTSAASGGCRGADRPGQGVAVGGAPRGCTCWMGGSHSRGRTPLAPGTALPGPGGRGAVRVAQGRPPHPRQLREPEGAKTSCWQRWQRRRRAVGRRLGEAARRLAQGFGLWDGALYEIGGRTPTRTPPPTTPPWSLSVQFSNPRRPPSRLPSPSLPPPTPCHPPHPQQTSPSFLAHPSCPERG